MTRKFLAISAIVIAVLLAAAACKKAADDGDKSTDAAKATATAEATANPGSPTTDPGNATADPGSSTADPGTPTTDPGDGLSQKVKDFLAQDENTRQPYVNGEFDIELYRLKWTPKDLGGKVYICYSNGGAGWMADKYLVFYPYDPDDPNFKLDDLIAAGLDYDGSNLDHMNQENGWTQWTRQWQLKKDWNVSFVNTGANSGGNEYVDNIVASRMTGNHDFDISDVSATTALSFYNNDFLLTWDDFMPANADPLNTFEPSRFVTNGGGKITGLNLIVSAWNPMGVIYSGARIIGVNVDLIGEIGIKDPRDFYKEGTWNWANFEATLKAVAAASTAERELVPFAGTYSYTIGYLIAGNGGRIYDDEKKEFLFEQPNVVAALNFYERLLVDEKLIFVIKNNVTADYEQTFMNNSTLLFAVPGWLLDQKNIDSKIGIISFPFGPDNTDGKNHFGGIRGCVIFKGTDDPMTLYKLFEYGNSHYGDDPDILIGVWKDSMTNASIEKPADVERWLVDIGTNQVAGDMYWGIVSSMFGSIAQKAYDGEATMASGLAAQSQMIKEKIIETVGE